MCFVISVLFVNRSLHWGHLTGTLSVMDFSFSSFLSFLTFLFLSQVLTRSKFADCGYSLLLMRLRFSSMTVHLALSLWSSPPPCPRRTSSSWLRAGSLTLVDTDQYRGCYIAIFLQTANFPESESIESFISILYRQMASTAVWPYRLDSGVLVALTITGNKTV